MRIAMPAHMQSSLIFHYNLKFYDSDGDGFDGVSLKRFVMQVGVWTNCPGSRILCDVARTKEGIAAAVLYSLQSHQNMNGISSMFPSFYKARTECDIIT